MLILFSPTLLIAQTGADESSFPVSELVVGLTPVIVWLATYLMKKFVLPKIPGILILVLVPLISGALTWITNASMDVNLDWYLQVIYGLGAVFIDQINKQLKTSS